MLKLNVDFLHMLIGVEGAKTSAGAAGQVRPRRRFSAEEAHRPPLRCAKRLERKSTFLFNRAKTKKTPNLEFFLFDLLLT
ncbi:hypothetical protein B1NLA3E_03760 [Bacillus sp. 1NLA3E]|nr:hypothetical protein B1NLA3E_03760 [Bacillus sp. 1NLA3E]